MKNIVKAMYGLKDMTGEELFILDKALDEKAKQITDIWADHMEKFLSANNLDVMNKAFQKVESLDSLLIRLYAFKAKVIVEKRELDARTKLTS